MYRKHKQSCITQRCDNINVRGFDWECWKVWLTLMFEGVTDLDVGQCGKLCMGLKREYRSQANDNAITAIS